MTINQLVTILLNHLEKTFWQSSSCCIDASYLSAHVWCGFPQGSLTPCNAGFISNTMFMFYKDTAACSHTREGPQSQSHCTLITHLALSGLSGSFTCHLIWHTSRWWSAESSVSLFTWVSKSYSWDEMVKWIKNKNLVFVWDGQWVEQKTLLWFRSRETPPGLSIVTYLSAELLISKGFPL